MNTIHRILIGLAVATLAPAAAGAQRISYDIGRANFDGLRTFAFRDAATGDNSTEATTGYDSPLVRQRTHEAIASQLEARGLRRDDEHPDMYITTRRTFKTEQRVYVQDWGPGYGYGWGWGWGWSPYYTGWGPWYGSTAYTEDRIIGTLILDVENAATGQLLWRGLAEKHVHEHASAEHRTKRVNKEVAKLFDKFPRTGVVATSGHEVAVPTDR